MKFTQTLLPLFVPATAPGATAATLDKRETTICGQWDSAVTGTYTVYQDLWGEATATSGSQCTTVTSDVNGTLVWSTPGTWAGGPCNVKSFANATVSMTKKKISAYTSIPTKWKWRRVIKISWIWHEN